MLYIQESYEYFDKDKQIERGAWILQFHMLFYTKVIRSVLISRDQFGYYYWCWHTVSDIFEGNVMNTILKWPLDKLYVTIFILWFVYNVLMLSAFLCLIIVWLFVYLLLVHWSMLTRKKISNISSALSFIYLSVHWYEPPRWLCWTKKKKAKQNKLIKIKVSGMLFVCSTLN